MKCTRNQSLALYLLVALLLATGFSGQVYLISQYCLTNDDGDLVLPLSVLAGIGMFILFARLGLATFGVIWNYHRRGIFRPVDREIPSFIRSMIKIDIAYICIAIFFQTCVDIYFFKSLLWALLPIFGWCLLAATMLIIWLLTSNNEIAPIFYGIIYEENIRF